MTCIVCGHAISDPKQGHLRCDRHMVAECWKSVEGYEGLYEVSSLGRVRSLRRIVGSRPYGGRVLSQINCKPYKMVDLSKGNQAKKVSVHRLVCAAFHGGEAGLCRHLNGDDQNNEATNLKWGSHIDNEADKKSHNKHNYGSRNAGSKLTWGAVRSIRALAKQGQTRGALAKQFGISRSQCGKIINGTSWSTGGDPQRRERRRARKAGAPLKSKIRTVSGDTVLVIQIRLLRGEQQRAIAADLGVSQSYVSLVNVGKRGNPCGRYIASQAVEVAA